MNLKKVCGDDKELLTRFGHELHELAQIKKSLDLITQISKILSAKVCVSACLFFARRFIQIYADFFQ